MNKITFKTCNEFIGLSSRASMGPTSFSSVTLSNAGNSMYISLVTATSTTIATTTGTATFYLYEEF